jgi:hypothetical protein
MHHIFMKLQRDLHNKNTTMGHNLMRVTYKVSSCYLHSSEKPTPKQLHQLWTMGVDKYIVTMNATSTVEVDNHTSLAKLDGECTFSWLHLCQAHFHNFTGFTPGLVDRGYYFKHRDPCHSEVSASWILNGAIARLVY